MTVTCPNCEWSTEVPDEKIPVGGGKGTCPKCRAKIEVKNATSSIVEQQTVCSSPIQRATKPCPLCGEEILSVAKKCKHCNSMLDEADEKISVNQAGQTAQLTTTKPYEKKSTNNKFERLFAIILKVSMGAVVSLIVILGIKSCIGSKNAGQNNISKKYAPTNKDATTTYEGTVLDAQISGLETGVVTTKGTFTVEEINAYVPKGQEAYFNEATGQLTVGRMTYKARRGLI